VILNLLLYHFVMLSFVDIVTLSF